jgi:hypothetical protein
MLVMPANATGWLWHCMARETGRIGHLFSPNAQRQTFPWFPYALDNGAYSCYDLRTNEFDHKKWHSLEEDWKRMLVWTQTQPYQPRWAIVPDVIGDKERTIAQWSEYAKIIQEFEIPLAVAVQDGMDKDDVRSLSPAPEVVAVGGTTEWKWNTVDYWARCFDRVHVLRCNSPERLYELEAMGIESCDGTGWNRGNRKQTEGLEKWARRKAITSNDWLSHHSCKGIKKKEKNQITFA